MAQVAAQQAQLQALAAEVLLISFEGRQFAGPWLRQMEVPFTMLIDETRAAYQAYGLKRSFWHSWGLKNLWYYAKALFKGRHIERVRSDSTQLGGDFIVDAGGTVRFSHASQDPTDRPDVEQLLSVLSGQGD